MIIIFGSSGMLGHYMTTYFKNSINIDRQKFNITKQYNNIESFLLSIISCTDNKTNNIIINCAGTIKQRSNSKLNDFIIVNTLFPIYLSIACHKLNIKLIHITTDCVFSGLSGNYTELDNSDVNDIYGSTKYLDENIDATIIRTSIIGEELNNKLSLIEWVKSNENKTINGFTNHLWNGVTCLELCKIIENIINNKLFWKGIKHIFSPTSISKYDLLQYINSIYKLNITITKTESVENINRTLSTIYSDFIKNFNIQNIYDQIIDLYFYKI